MTAAPELLLDRVRAATADEYVIEGELARGGMAAVFLARDIALDRRVAIKVMLPDLMGVAGSQDRFVVEARTGAQLDHPGIVTVYAVKQRAGLTFIVMKYIEGWTLDYAIATRGALDPGVIATIGTHVAEALHFAHSQGVVHRDVKPSNIIIDTHGRPVVTDFGIAKVSTGPALTVAGTTVGTPSYMSPEQCRGLTVTAASDQYSLGIVLYEMLTGRVPFSGTLFELLTAHTTNAPPPIRDVKPDVDPSLEAIITIMLAKDQSERFPSLFDVARALAWLVPNRSQSADRHAIMAAVAPEHLESPSAASVASLPEAFQEATDAITEQMVSAPPVINPDIFAIAVAEDAPPPSGQSQAGTVEPPLAAGGTPPRPARSKRVVTAVVAAALLVAVGYAITSRSTAKQAPAQPAPPLPSRAASLDSVAPAKPTDSASAVKPDTSLAARTDTAPSAKRDTAAKLPPPAAPKSRPASTPAPRTGSGPKRDSVSQTRPDSIAARCAAVNLKFSLGEELTRPDTIFLRRECAKPRPSPEL